MTSSFPCKTRDLNTRPHFSLHFHLFLLPGILPQVLDLVEAYRSSHVAARDQTLIGELQMSAALQRGQLGQQGLNKLCKYEANYITQVGKGEGG